MSGTALHMCWKNMKQRCFNPKSSRYEHYGARGITICEDWLTFEGFLRWALAAGYTEGLTIDRKDTAGNYTADNCRWIPYEENHARMMAENLERGTGIFSAEAKANSKDGLRKALGKPILLSKAGTELHFSSRGEAIEFLSEELGRISKV